MADPRRLKEELQRMRVLIASNPEVKAQFDRDGNGVIDGEEWEAVRMLVVRRLDQEEAQARAAARLTVNAPQPPPPSTPAAVPGVAERIFSEDLPAVRGAPVHQGGLTQASVFILQQSSMAHQVLGEMVRRSFTVRLPDGREAATLQQVEHQGIQNLMQRTATAVEDLNFRATDLLGGATAMLTRSQQFGDDRVTVTGGDGALLAYTQWVPGLVWRKYRVVPALDEGTLTVQGQVWRPFTFRIVDVVDDEVGVMEAGWTGLTALLTHPNQVRVQLDPARLNPGLWWGLLAAALMAAMGLEWD